MRLASIAALGLGLSSGAIAADSDDAVSKPLDPEQLAFFENKIRPALVEHCYKCHAADSEKIKGGLLLDTREGALKGGESGHAVVPENLRDSLLFTAITYADKELEMPPKYQLDEDVIADFEKWILMGAPDPRDGSGGKVELARTEIDIEKGREFWAYQPPKESGLPKVSNENWPRADLDHYVLAKLDENNLAPSGDAERRTLMRRVYFDLIGLPPTPGEVEAFVNDDDPMAFEKIVDRLLASEQYGERWGRHWLDVARYAESSGKEANITFPHAWRYRDYVINSFNEDKPYDRFITEQIAGDLLPYDEYSEQAEYLVATGFLAMGPKSLNAQERRQFKMDVVDEQIDTVTQAILGTTVACARCHDHKFDPIPTTDYYAMAGIFLSTDAYYGTVGTQGNRRSEDLLKLAGVGRDQIVERDLTLEEIGQLEESLDSLRKEQRELQASFRQPRENGDPVQNFQILQRLISRVASTEAILGSVDRETGKRLPFGMGVWEASYREPSSFPRDANVLVRGELDKASSTVPRGFVQVLCKEGEEKIEDRSASGRLELAEWLTSSGNPLTARVMANRIWHHLFGQGIVTSMDNFGSTGRLPSHPELLDHLALRFIEHGWSIKSMVREIVLSRTYRQSSDFNEKNYAVDPDNTWVWRMSKRRLDAEALRDAILAVSGNLDLERPLGSLVAEIGDGQVQRLSFNGGLEQPSENRSVYLPIVRDLLPAALELFDFAEPSLVTGSRDSTNVPSQALYLMNSDFINTQSYSFARQLVQSGKTGADLLAEAFSIAFSRPPSAEEARKTTAFFDRFLVAAAEEGHGRDEARFLALKTYCQGLLAGADFRYLN